MNGVHVRNRTFPLLSSKQIHPRQGHGRSSRCPNGTEGTITFQLHNLVSLKKTNCPPTCWRRPWCTSWVSHPIACCGRSPLPWRRLWSTGHLSHCFPPGGVCFVDKGDFSVSWVHKLCTSESSNVAKEFKDVFLTTTNSVMEFVIKLRWLKIVEVSLWKDLSAAKTR